jgi:hypothetical protein
MAATARQRERFVFSLYEMYSDFLFDVETY